MLKEPRISLRKTNSISPTTLFRLGDAKLPAYGISITVLGHPHYAVGTNPCHEAINEYE